MITRDTRQTLDRYLALTIKDLRIKDDGLRYAFDLHCKDCGGYQLNAPDGDADHHVAYCQACGIKFGMLGEIRAYAAELAAKHRDEAQPPLKAVPVPVQQFSKVVIGTIAVASVAGLILNKPAPMTKPSAASPPSAVSVPSNPVPEPSPPQPKAAEQVAEAGPAPITILAPLPPPRPAGLSLQRRAPSR